MDRARFERIEPVVSLLLALLGCGLAVHALAGNSATTDEPVHLASAVEIVREGTGRWNVEHPPLAKALGGLALTGLPLDPAGDPFAPRTGSSAPLLLKFLFQNRTPGEEVLFRARLAFVALFAALLAAVRAEARRRFGAAAGLFALGLAALEPTLVAHAGVVHTDLAVTLFAVLALAPLARLADPAASRAAWLLGLFWGLAFLSKYSAPLLAVVLLPVGLLGLEVRSAGKLVARRLALAALVAAAVSLAGFGLAYRHQSAADRDSLTRDRIATKGRSPALASALESAGRLLPPLQNLGTGALSIALQSRIGAGPNFFLGRTSTGGSPLYFPVALATKTTLALLLAGLLGAFAPAGRRFAAAAGLGVAVFVAISAGSSYAIGVRHVLFAFPLAALAASAALAGTPGRRVVAVSAAILLLKGAEAASAHPSEMAFFNAAAGGRDGGRRLFVDSNLDWGQDLARLAVAAPGLSPSPLPAVVFAGDLASRYPSLRPPEPADLVRRGQIVAVGEQPFAIGPELLASRGAHEDAARLAALRTALVSRGERVGSIGGSIGIWRIERAPN